MILSDEQKKTLAEKYYLKRWKEKRGHYSAILHQLGHKQEEVDALVLDISKLV